MFRARRLQPTIAVATGGAEHGDRPGFARSWRGSTPAAAPRSARAGAVNARTAPVAHPRSLQATRAFTVSRLLGGARQALFGRPAGDPKHRGRRPDPPRSCWAARVDRASENARRDRANAGSPRWSKWPSNGPGPDRRRRRPRRHPGSLRHASGGAENARSLTAFGHRRRCVPPTDKGTVRFCSFGYERTSTSGAGCRRSPTPISISSSRSP